MIIDKIEYYISYQFEFNKNLILYFELIRY